METKNNDVTNIQRAIGYNFKNTDLLDQAFVRRSYSQEYGGENNEVLEFIGDRVLDYIVTVRFTEEYGKIQKSQVGKRDWVNAFVCEFNEGELTEKKSRLVEKKNLAKRMKTLGFSEYLLMSKGDIKNDLKQSAPVMEDLFEALIGAIAVDSNFNIEKIRDVINIMLDLDNYFLDEKTGNNYVSEIQHWSQKKYGELPEVNFVDLNEAESKTLIVHKQNEIVAPWGGNSDTRIADLKKCTVCLKNIPLEFIGYGYSKNEASKAANKAAYEYLEKNNLLLSIRDENINPKKDTAITQLETLSRRGYFSIPEYKFEESRNKNGNTLWTCECAIAGIDKGFSFQSASKKLAKKNSAFKMLKYVLEATK